MGRMRVVIVGGGVAAVEAMLALRDLAEDRVAVELVAPEPYFWYAPLAVSEPFGASRAQHFDLALLAQSCGALFTPCAVVAIDADRRRVHTVAGRTDAGEIDFDALVLATGARRRAAVTGALTFRGPADVDAVRFVVDEVASGRARRLVFAVPTGVTWPLPAYELALQAAHRLDGGAEVALVTPEQTPLEMFGAPASAAVARLLHEHRVGFRAGEEPEDALAGTLRLASAERVAADRVVALPQLHGDPPAGVPRDANGFVAVDDDGRVDGVDAVWAAGDGTDYPIKQGGIAAQQADAVAEDIAVLAGAELDPQPFRPILRALLLTGDTPLYLRTDPAQPDEGLVATEPLWWPPAKIVGRYLAPFLAELQTEREQLEAVVD